MSFSPDHANHDYEPNYNTPKPKSSDIERRAAAFNRKFKRKIPLSRERIGKAAEASRDEASLDQSKKRCSGLFCGLFSGGKRRTKKRRKKRRTKSRRKTKRRRKSRRRTKRRRRKR
tara:strand:- start:11579 stop:11926 length:348 start_codon:yes stop_codon:yes gene_type:complete